MRLCQRSLLALLQVLALLLTPCASSAAWDQHGPAGSADLQSYLLHATSPVTRSGRVLLSEPDAPPAGAFEAVQTEGILAGHAHVFATAICRDDMEAGVTVLHEGLLASGHREPLVVLAATEVSAAVRHRLSLLPLAHLYGARGDRASFCGVRAAADDAAAGCAHLKLLLFGLERARKVVFLEYDSVVLRPLADLTALPAFSAVREPHVGLFETAVMVVEPDAVVYRVLWREFCERVTAGDLASDHDVIRSTVPDEAWSVASDTFNVPQEHMDALWYRRVDTTPAVIHYKGAAKPWNWWRLGTGDPISQEAFNRWCEVARTTPFACDVPEGDAMIPSMQPNGWSDKRRLTVLLSTYHRPTWKSLTRHYTSFKVVSQVIVVWHDPSGDPPLASTLGLKVVVWQPKADSLNNRFVAPGNLTECVYVCDDDMKVTEVQLMRGFNIWKGHSRRLVGYFPRRWKLEPPYYSARVHDGYNIVLTKGLFTHRYFLYMYVHLLPKRIKSIVNRYHDCEDILFNMMVSGYSGVAPLHVLVEGTIVDLGHGGGISSRDAHYTHRYKCIHALIGEMGVERVPLTIGSYSHKPLKNKERE